MRRLCQNSRRWHQQFYQSLDRASHQNCIIKLPAVRQYRQRVKARTIDGQPRPKGNELKVREFDQVGPSTKDVVEVKPNAEVEKASKELRAEIEQLDAELAILRQGPFGPDSDFMRSLPPEDRAKALKVLEEEGLAGDESENFPDDDEIDRLLEEGKEKRKIGDTTHTQGVTLRIPAQQKAYVKQFNKSLESVAEDASDLKQGLLLWRWYLRCQQYVPGFSNIIPEDVWQILWQSQSKAMNSSKRLIILAKDMLSIQMPLTPAQWIDYIESLLLDGDAGSAVAAWEENRSDLGSNGEIASTFWSLGVRIYCELGRPRKAQEIATDCLAHGSFAEAQILTPVIAAWADSQHPAAQSRAWACYLRLKSEMGNKMTPAVFEEVSTAFLRKGKADMALAVFKDMLLNEENSAHDSNVVYQKAIELVHLQSRAISEENINHVSLAALLVLPKSFQNKFFYGSWIKKLIGNGEVDAAAAVVELMYERGVKPDARHLNGIVGAWLRDGSPSSRKKAQEMAWAMIHARIGFVQRRAEIASSSSQSGSTIQDHKRPVPAFLRRRIPPATIETFSILLLYYTRRSNDEAAERLISLMTGPAQITPNSFVMNHSLYAALRKADIQGVWNIYKALTKTVHPDLETFACLWDTAKVQYDKSKAAHAADFPSARVLYGQMSNWLSNLSVRDLQKSRDAFSRDLYDQIVRSFCLSSDLNGTLCALHGLQTAFGEYPDSDTARMIVIQITRLLPQEAQPDASTRRSFRRRGAHSRNAISKVAGILETVADQKYEALVKEGINPDDMDESTAKQTQLQILSKFIFVILKRLQGARGDAQNDVRNIAKVMGVDITKIDFKSIESEV
jgi:pentatricopeptide repeat protein